MKRLYYTSFKRRWTRWRSKVEKRLFEDDRSSPVDYNCVYITERRPSAVFLSAFYVYTCVLSFNQTLWTRCSHSSFRHVTEIAYSNLSIWGRSNSFNHEFLLRLTGSVLVELYNKYSFSFFLSTRCCVRWNSKFIYEQF